MNDSVAELQAILAHADFWSSVSTLFVAIGVVAELIILFVFTREIRPTEKAFLVVANVLIVAGCLGEWEYGGKATAASEKLQSIANTKAAKAILDAAAANKRAAGLEKEAAQLRLDLAKINAPRRLLADQTERIAKQLPSCQCSYRLFTYPNMEEPASFAFDIEGLLSGAAGWKRKEFQLESWGLEISGVWVIMTASATREEGVAAATLANALFAEHIDAAFVPWPRTSGDLRTGIAIVVGHKP